MLVDVDDAETLSACNLPPKAPRLPARRARDADAVTRVPDADVAPLGCFETGVERMLMPAGFLVAEEVDSVAAAIMTVAVASSVSS